MMKKPDAKLLKVTNGGNGREACSVAVYVATPDFEYVEKYWTHSKKRVFHALGGVIESVAAAALQEQAARALCKDVRRTYAYKKIVKAARAEGAFA